MEKVMTFDTEVKGAVIREMRIRRHLVGFKNRSYLYHREDESGNGCIDCSLGINPFGYSPRIDGTIDTVRELHLSTYPDVGYTNLKKRLLEYWSFFPDLDEKNILVGAGSFNFLTDMNRLFLDVTDRVLGYCPQFPDYATDVERHGGCYNHINFDEKEFYAFDADSVIENICGDHKIIYIDNPNNPTGQIIPLGELERIIQKAEQKNVCVLLDEAYGDYMDRTDSGISLVNTYGNLLVARTFSKGFGLGGLRIGYAVTGHKLSAELDKVKTPITVSRLSEHIASIALEDEGFLSDCRRRIRNIKGEIISECRKLRVMKTAMDVPIMVLVSPDRRLSLYSLFRQRGVLTEPGLEYRNLGDHAIRLRVPASDSPFLIEAIHEIEKLL